MSHHHHAGHTASGSDHPTFKARKRSTGEIIRRVWVYVRPYYSLAIATIGCAILSLIFAIIYPKLTQVIIDEIIQKETGDTRLLGWAVLCLAGAFLLRDVFNSLRIRINNHFEQNGVYDMRRDVYGRLQRLPVRYYDKRASGDLMTRVVEDINNVERVLIDGTEQGTVAILAIGGTIADPNASFAPLSSIQNSLVSDAGAIVLAKSALNMHCWGKNPIYRMVLQLNGQDRFSERAGKWFDLVQPFKYHTHLPDTGINLYSFALKPEDHNPSGTLNFSRIDNANLRLTLSNFMLNSYNSGVAIKVYATNYNILRIMSGMGGLAYSN